MQAGTVILSTPEALAVLRDRLRDTFVLSAYLDTSPQRTDGPGWTFALRDGCKDIRATLNDPVAEGFEAAVQVAEAFLEDDFTPSHPGLAIFGTANMGGYAVNLPYRPVEGVAWAKGAQIEPLVDTLDEFERIAVALVDQQDARLYTVFLGEIETRRALEDYVPRRQATGGWYGLSQTRYERHREDHVLRHINRTIDALLDLQRERPFDRLLIGGPDEAMAVFRRKLPSTLRAKVAGTVSMPLFASERDVLESARAVAERIERGHELEMVTELVEAAGLTHTAVGIDATLAALGDGRVHQLILSDTFESPGARCQTCHRLLPATARCTWCDAATMPVPDLREQIVRRAMDQGAGIEIVHGEAAAKLGEHGGLGAWTRY